MAWDCDSLLSPSVGLTAPLDEGVLGLAEVNGGPRKVVWGNLAKDGSGKSRYFGILI